MTQDLKWVCYRDLTMPGNNIYSISAINSAELRNEAFIKGVTKEIAEQIVKDHNNLKKRNITKQN